MKPWHSLIILSSLKLAAGNNVFLQASLTDYSHTNIFILDMFICLLLLKAFCAATGSTLSIQFDRIVFFFDANQVARHGLFKTNRN